MRISPRLAEYVRRSFSDGDSRILLHAIEILDTEYIDNQGEERIGLAMAILVGRGIDPDKVLGSAQRDWRDLLMGAGLADEDWETVMSAYLEPDDS